MNRLPSAPPTISGFSYIRPLGTGGFADVFLFEQNLPRRSVAVKVLLQSVVDADVLRMFNTEADVMARLSAHPSILTVYAASVSADGRPYLVMEYCPQSPASRFRSQPLSVSDVLNIGVRIASALESAHRTGVLHRDVKPSNILATGYGSPVLSDFGIATSLASRETDEEIFAMSVPWSAPEVIDEVTTGSVASEVWSLGATLYSLLAGRTPFELAGGKTTNDQLKQRIRKARYESIGRADVPAALEQLLASTMNPDAAQRPTSMLSCARAMQAIQQELGLPVTAVEVASDEWASAAAPIDFDNTIVRAPMVSTVAVASARVRTRSSARPQPAATPVAKPVKSSAASAKVWVLIGSGLVVGAASSVLVMALVR